MAGNLIHHRAACHDGIRRRRDEAGFEDFRELFADRRQLRLVGDDENVFGRHQRQNAVNSLLEKRAFAKQHEQLLGRLVTAHRPKPLFPGRRP